MSVSTRTLRSLAALALTTSALVAVSTATVAAPPAPSVGVTATCTNDVVSGGNVSQDVDVSIDAAYKGRWVDFSVSVTVSDASNASKSRPISRHDSTDTWVATFTFLTLGSEATSASVEVQVLDNKGVPVGTPAPWSGSCAAAS
jgi:hypothetical protein